MNKYQKLKLILGSAFCISFLVIFYNFLHYDTGYGRYAPLNEPRFIDTKTGDVYFLTGGKVKISNQGFKESE